MCTVHHVKTKSVFTYQPKKTSFYDSEKWKVCCHVLNFHFRNQKLTIMLFGGDGLHCFAFTHYHFIPFQSTLKQHDFLSLLRRYWVVSGVWTRFSDSDCEKSRPINANNSRRKSSASLELVVVSKTTVLEQPFSASSSYPQPARNTWYEGRSTFKCRCTRRLGLKRVSGVCCSGRSWILLGKWSTGCGHCF